MNFQTILEELDRLYEGDGQNEFDYKGHKVVFANNGECSVIDPKGKHLKGNLTDKEAREFIDAITASESTTESLVEAADNEEVEEAEVEIEVDDDNTSDTVTEEAPRQIILECDKCGALVLREDADIVIDEEAGLVNVEEACQYCEDTAGYKIIGTVAPYEEMEAE